MKREYFGMLFIFTTLIIILSADYFIGESVWDYLNKFIIIWILVAFYAGQYSMKFPKAF